MIGAADAWGTVRYSTAGMPSDNLLRVAVIPHARAPLWNRAVFDSLRETQGLDLDIQSSTNPQSAIRNPQSCDAIVDLAGTATDVEPRFGVWRYAFGDGAPLADGAPGTYVRLQRSTPDPDRAVVLHEGWYRARTAEAWGTRSVGIRVAPWAARVLRQIQLGDRRIVDRAPHSTAGCRDPLPPEPPSPLGAVRVDAMDTVRSWLTRQRWTIGVIPIGVEDIIQRGTLPEPTWLAGQPSDRFYADPFPIAVCGDRMRVLVEEYIYPSRVKRLAEIEIGCAGDFLRRTGDGTLPRPASYPFLLRRDGRLFCMPETSGARRVSSFVSDDGGRSWMHHRDVLTGFPFVDATLVEHDGTWWMFCTKQGDEDQTELHVFFATDWCGPWQPHPLNPVKSDTRSSRPAGACLRIDGVLYRPAQDCARRYGAGLAINRIVELSPRAFREETVLSLRPSRSSLWPHGLHTINSIGGITVVDGLRVERRWEHPAIERQGRKDG
jgi:hypothetical protein